jgi:O-antigen/teichoic acid export membrane protein
MAFNLATLPERRFSPIITKVAFPMLSKIQSDSERSGRVYLKMLQHISSITFPLLAGLAIMAPRLVKIVLSTKWEGAIIPLQIMCVAGILKSVGTTVGSVFYSQGRPDLEFKLDVFTLFTIIPCLLIGLKFGITGVATATTIYTLFSILLYFKFAGSLLNLSVKTIIYSMFHSFLATVLMLFVTIFLNLLLPNSFLSLLIIIPSSIVIYLFFIYIIKKEIITEWKSLPSLVRL